MIPDKTAYRIDQFSTEKAAIRIGGSAEKFVPNLNLSFPCHSDTEKYFINLNRRSVVVKKQVAAKVADKAVLQIGNEKDIWYQDQDGNLKWDIEFAQKPKTNIFDWELKCSPELEFRFQPPLTDYEIKRGWTRTHIGGYAIFCDQRGHYVDSDGKTICNYRHGKIASIHRPVVIDAKGNKTFADLLIDKKIRLLRITIPQEFLDSATYPVTLDPTFGHDGSTPFGTGLYQSSDPAQANVLSSHRHTAGANETIVKMTGYGRISGTAGMGSAVYSYSGGVPVTRAGDATSADFGTTDDWYESETLNIPLTNGTTYVVAVGNITGPGDAYGGYDVGTSGDTSQQTSNTLGTTWSENSVGAYPLAVYATYVVSQSLTRDVSWKILNSIDRDTRWNLLTAVEHSTGWGLLTAKTADTGYRILAAIERNVAARILNASEQDTAFKIINSIIINTAARIFTGLDRDSSWSILAKSDQSTSWSILNRIDSDLAWQILLANVLDADLAWQIITSAGVDLDIAWAVKTAKEQITGYRVMAAKDQDAAWSIANAVTEDLSWKVLNIKDQQAAWGLLTQISQDTAWKVFTVTDQDLAWSILTHTEQDTGWQLFDAADLDTAWDVLSDIVPEPIKVFMAQRRTFIFNAERRTFIFFA